MKLFDFMLLEQYQQTDLLYHSGTYLGKRKNGTTATVLYQMDGFYVEITYRKYRCVISAIRCFENTGPLDPYLDRINIEELISC